MRNIKKRVVISAIFIILITVLLISTAYANCTLNVSFLPQVPPGDWTNTKNCGPTCCVMVEAFLKGVTPTSDRLKAVDDWLNSSDYNGKYTNCSDLQNILKNMMGFSNTYVYSSQTTDNIKSYINSGIPVIVPVTRVYQGTITGHFILCKGYDDTYLYFNDPGRNSSIGPIAKYTYTDFNNTIWQSGKSLVIAYGSSSPLPTPSPSPSGNTPTLNSPSNGTQIQINSNIGLSWSGNGVTRFHLQVTNPSGSNTDIHALTQTNYSFSPNVAGTWYWKVIAENSSGSDTGSWSECRNFTVIDNSKPSTPSETYSVQYYKDTGCGTVGGSVSSESGLTSINKNWGSSNAPGGCTSNLFSAVFTGNINFNTGWYRFNYTVDDSIKLWLTKGSFTDCICDNNGQKDSPQSGSRYYNITSVGTYTVRVEYIKCHAGTAVVQVSWIPISAPMMTVTFETLGGSYESPVTSVVDSMIGVPPQPEKTGYSFAGWYKDPGYANKWNFSADKISGNTTLYAKWAINSYSVNFNSLGGSNVTNITTIYNTTISKPTNPTYIGYDFGGWYKEASCNNAWNFSSDKVTEDIILYAKWTSNKSYIVTFDSQGGSAAGTITAAEGSYITAPSPPEKPGYSFDGWYKESRCVTPWDFSNDAVTGNITLYAKWCSNITGPGAQHLMASGWAHTLYIDKNKNVYGWGNNCEGQLGLGTSGGNWYNYDPRIDQSTRQKVPGLTNAVSVAAGAHHSLILCSDGTVWAAGSNIHGQLGNGKSGGNYYDFDAGIDSNIFIQISGLSGVKSIACGSNSSFAVKDDGTVWSFGVNLNGELGNSSQIGGNFYTYNPATDVTAPKKVDGLNGVTKVVSGDFTIALKGDGTVWSWGLNSSGQLGDGTTTNRCFPVQVLNVSNVVDIAIVENSTLILKSDGSVWTWGDNSNGSLGNGKTVNSLTPVKANISENVTKIYGGDVGKAISVSGKIYTWGKNYSGALGIGTSAKSPTPVKLSDFGYSTVEFMSGGSLGYSALAYESDGSIWAWGDNWCGQLGLGTAGGMYSYAYDDSVDTLSPVLISGFYTVGFDSRGGSSIQSMIIESGKTINKPDMPTEKGYTFAGWYREAAYINPWNFSNDTVTGNITLYAKWNSDVITCTVAFDSKGGSQIATLSVPYNSKINAPAEPTKSNYYFAGWYKESECKNLWDFAADRIRSNTTLYAKWNLDANTFTVTFDSQGGSGVANLAVPKNSKITKPASPSRTGYTFAGWYKETKCKHAWSFSKDKVKGNITLFAKWNINKYTIKFNTEGGSKVSSKKANYNAAISQPKKPKKTGYTFAGWYKEEGLVKAWNFVADRVTGNTTLFAKWNAKIYNVRFNSKGGSAVGGITAGYNSFITAPVSPTKTGYTFAGWYKEAKCKHAWNFSEYKIKNTTTLYAKWVSQ